MCCVGRAGVGPQARSGRASAWWAGARGALHKKRALRARGECARRRHGAGARSRGRSTRRPAGVPRSARHGAGAWSGTPGDPRNCIQLAKARAPRSLHRALHSGFLVPTPESPPPKPSSLCRATRISRLRLFSTRYAPRAATLGPLRPGAAGRGGGPWGVARGAGHAVQVRGGRHVEGGVEGGPRVGERGAGQGRGAVSAVRATWRGERSPR